MSGIKAKKRYEIDMCSGPVLKKMLFFAVPLMCSSILQLLFNAADIIVVGRFAGDNSLAAVGSNTSLISLMTNLFVGLSIGANVLAARHYGAREEKELNETVHTAMTLSLVSGIILTAIGIPMAKQILAWMQTPEEVRDLAAVYLRIYFVGMTAMMVYNFGSAVLRAVGDTKRPLYYLFTAGVVNVILNLFFVIGFRMDVAGVALATVISQCISAFLVVRCLIREEGGLKLSLRRLHINKKELTWILRVGLPAGCQGVIFDISNVVIQSSVNLFGAVVVAGNSAASNVEGFVYFAMNAFYQATLSFTSQNVGAGNLKRVDKVLATGLCCSLVVGLIMGNGAALFGESLLGIYSSNPEVIAAGMRRMLIICCPYALCGIMDNMVGALRGMGYSVLPMIVSLVGVCGLRLLWLGTVFQMEEFHTIEMIYLAYPITWVITLSVHVVCFIMVRKKLWSMFAASRG